MAITATSAPGMGPSSRSIAGSSELGKDQFIQLLLAQLQNQDPTSPVDGQAFVAQLAQFSSLEQLQGVSARLDSLVLAQASSNQLQTAGLVGKEIRFASSDLSLSGIGGTKVEAELPSPAATVTATITDANGKTVRTLTHGLSEKGALAIPWDGLDDNGVPLPAGDYTVKLVAADEAGTPVEIEPRGRGRVRGVSFENGYPELLVDGLKVKLSDVVEVIEAALASTPSGA